MARLEQVIGKAPPTGGHSLQQHGLQSVGMPKPHPLLHHTTDSDYGKLSISVISRWI